MSSSLDSILDAFCAQVYNATGNSRNLTYDSTNNETKIWGECKVEKITIPNNQFYIETTNTQTIETIDENTGEPTTQTITTTSSASIYDVFAALNHTHSVINNNLTINGSANVLYLYGNNVYSRFCVARDANTSKPAVYGYDDNAKCAYMKILSASTELLVYNNKVVVQSGDLFIGNTNIMTEINGKADSNHTHAISDITDLSTTLANLTPNEHRHKISDIYRIVKILNEEEEEEEEEEALEDILNDKANVNHTHSYSDLTNIPSTFTPSSHTHTVNNITDFEDEVESIINSEVMPTIGDLTSSIGDLGDSLSNYVLSTDLSTTLASYSQTNHTHSYSSLTNIPSTFTPSSHSHTASEITDLSTTLASYSQTNHTHSYSSLTNIPSTFTPSSHSHAISEITDLSTTLDGKASSSHTHTSLNNRLVISAPATDTGNVLELRSNYDYARLVLCKDWGTNPKGMFAFAKSVDNNDVDNSYAYIKLNSTGAKSLSVYKDYVQIDGDLLVGNTNIMTAINGKATTSHTHSYDDLTNIPSTFTPSSHTHGCADIFDIDETFAPLLHNHTISNITDLQTALDGKASSSHTHSTINNSLTINASNTNGYPIYIYGNATYNRLIIGKDSNTSTTSIVGHAAESTPYSYIKLSGGSAEFHMLSDKAMIYNGGLDVQGTSYFDSDISIRQQNSTQSHSLILTTESCAIHFAAFYDVNETVSRPDDEHVKLGIILHNKLESQYANNKIYLTYNNDVLKNETILHTALVETSEDFENIEVGRPVFMTGNTYKVVKDVFVASSANDSIDCVPSVSSSGTYKTFLGICAKKHRTGEKLLLGNDVKREFEFTQNCIEFATHGDYLFKVSDTSNYSVGDTILYDETILNDELPLNNRINRSIVGVISKIYDLNYLAVFKEN